MKTYLLSIGGNYGFAIDTIFIGNASTRGDVQAITLAGVSGCSIGDMGTILYFQVMGSSGPFYG